MSVSMSSSLPVAKRMQHSAEADKTASHAADASMQPSARSRFPYLPVLLSHLVALLASLTLLVLVGVAASGCASTVLADSASTLGHIRVATCSMDVVTRGWLLAMLALNVLTLAWMATLVSSNECCQLNLAVRGWRTPVLAIFALGHLVSSCMLVGWMYTAVAARDLGFTHVISIAVLIATLSISTGVGVSLGLYWTEAAGNDEKDSLTVSKRRNSLDLENARAAIAAETAPNSKSSSSPSMHSTSAHIRGRFPQASAAPVTVVHTGSLGSSGGMSLSEIQQLATQVVPCCTPSTVVDPATNELLTMPCCEHAPVLPSMATAAGFTSPRRKDLGPVAEYTDSQHGASQTSPAAAANSNSAPRHLRLNTASTPQHFFAAAQSPDHRLSNSPLALHAAEGSALQAVLMHGPLAADAECNLCKDVFREHDLLKVLPHCGHAFHSSCLVPYLRTKRDCPLCKTEVLSAEENRHHELSKLRMESPQSQSSPSSDAGVAPLGTPQSMRDAIDAARSPSTQTQPAGLNVLVSPAMPKASPERANALSSTAANLNSFHFAEVKLTPSGAPQARSSATTPAPISLRSGTSPTASRSPISTCSPIHPMALNLSPIVIPAK